MGLLSSADKIAIPYATNNVTTSFALGPAILVAVAFAGMMGTFLWMPSWPKPGEVSALAMFGVMHSVGVGLQYARPAGAWELRSIAYALGCSACAVYIAIVIFGAASLFPELASVVSKQETLLFLIVCTILLAHIGGAIAAAGGDRFDAQSLAIIALSMIMYSGLATVVAIVIFRPQTSIMIFSALPSTIVLARIAVFRSGSFRTAAVWLVALLTGVLGAELVAGVVYINVRVLPKLNNPLYEAFPLLAPLAISFLYFLEVAAVFPLMYMFVPLANRFLVLQPKERNVRSLFIAYRPDAVPAPKTILLVLLVTVLHPIAYVLLLSNLLLRGDIRGTEKLKWASVGLLWGAGPILYVSLGKGVPQHRRECNS
jgi:hypothetical protein